MAMTKEEAAYAKYRRIAVTPYWCEGSPLDWHIPEANIGIAHFAYLGHVGHFNLAWWLLARSEPPKDVRVYTNTPLAWVIQRAPFVMMTPQYSMTAAASSLSHREWLEVMTKREFWKHPAIEGYGVTGDMLRSLTLFGSREQH